MRRIPTAIPLRITKPATTSATRSHHLLPRSITRHEPQLQQTRPTSSTMSLFYPRSALSHPSSSLGNQPTFSSLFRMLDDFEKYAQQVSSGSLIPTNLGSSLLPSLPSKPPTRDSRAGIPLLVPKAESRPGALERCTSTMQGSRGTASNFRS